MILHRVNSTQSIALPASAPRLPCLAGPQKPLASRHAEGARHDENPCLLVAVDSEAFGEGLAAALGGHRFEVRIVCDVDSTLDHIQRHRPEMIVISRSLPGGDAFDVLRSLHPAHEDLPIIVLARRYDEVEHAVALELGADDYLRCEVSPQVVVARLRASLRRRSSIGALATRKTALRFGSLTLDLVQRAALRDSVHVPLTGGEFDVLWLLASQAGHVVERRQILRLTRGIENLCDDRSIDNRIYRIRAKLGDTEPALQRIKTVRSLGYLFSPFGW